jgi:hypothetical protein
MISMEEFEAVQNLDKIARFYSQYNAVLNKQLKNNIINSKDIDETDLKSIKILYLITENMLPNTPLVIGNLNLELQRKFEYIEFVKD